jgi:putative PIN family toxin of toxin-antitoxin system
VKLSMKAVFDTNVLISALIKAGKPRDLIFRMANEETLVLSKGIIEEFVTVAQHARIRKYVNSRDVDVFLSFLNTHAKLVRVSSKFSVVEADPADDVILRTAYDAKANFVVSGDRHLLSLGEFRGIRIVTIDEMMQFLETKTTR